MAILSKFPLDIVGSGQTLVWAVFTTDGANKPTLVVGHGINDVTRSGAGVYVAALDDKCSSLYAICNLNSAAAAATYFACCVASASGKTITITAMTEAGVATDVTCAANEHFIVIGIAKDNPSAVG